MKYLPSGEKQIDDTMSVCSLNYEIISPFFAFQIMIEPSLLPLAIILASDEVHIEQT
jgi:hypothetical protein